MKHGINFWGDSNNSRKIFILQKKIITIMASVKPRTSCRSLFKRLESLTILCGFIFSVTNFTVNSQEHFKSNSASHSVNTRNNTHNLHRPAANLSCFQKHAYYSGINIFNNVPCSLKTLTNKNVQFKTALKNTHTHFTLLINSLCLKINHYFSSFK
jgi:hypothetical protein